MCRGEASGGLWVHLGQGGVIRLESGGHVWKKVNMRKKSQSEIDGLISPKLCQASDESPKASREPGSCHLVLKPGSGTLAHASRMESTSHTFPHSPHSPLPSVLPLDYKLIASRYPWGNRYKDQGKGGRALHCPRRDYTCRKREGGQK